MNAEIKDVEIRQATADDIRVFYPNGCPNTAYAWVALYKGKISCLAGLIISRNGCCAFSEQIPGHGAPRLTVYRTALALMEHIKALKLPMYAACRSTNKMAQKFVQQLGFTWNRSYQNMELFVWRCSR